MSKNLHAKIKESLDSALPITIIVILLSVTLAPMSGEMLVSFLFGAACIIIGIGLFTLGTDTSMVKMGEKIGGDIVRTKKVGIILLSCLIIGTVVTVAEPDLRVLAEQVPIVDTMTMVLTVSAGVGIFLLIAFLRILFQIPLSRLLLFFYLGLFILALSPLVPNDFIPAAFDSGGVTTGPVTVPFIMALGIGLASIRGDRTATDDSFGLIALCSVGPILTMFALGAMSGNADVTAELEPQTAYANVQEVASDFLITSPHYFLEILQAMLPIVVMCAVFGLLLRRYNKKGAGNKHERVKVALGYVITFVGLSLFLLGANVGFLPVGQYLGQQLAEKSYSWILVPLGAVMGWFIVSAEPAVHILKQQVEEITDGNIKGKTLGIALSAGVAASVGLSMLRILIGVNLLWFLVPGYAVSLIITFFVPSIYTSVAFDAGGVASGPMTAAFLLPLAAGATFGHGGNLATDAFGIVAMVAMTPLITIQVLGLISQFAKKKAAAAVAKEVVADYIISGDELE